jgi:hypothetical protein
MIDRRSHITLVGSPERRAHEANEVDMPYSRYEEQRTALAKLEERICWLERQVTMALGGIVLTLITALWNALHK